MKNIHLLFILFCCLFIQAQEKTKKPLNIIWISCEDIGPILSAYGNETINTPNIDRIAAEGVKYTNVYSTVGVCSKSIFYYYRNVPC